MNVFRRQALARIFWLSVASAIAACGSLAPAKAPPQISHTPGAEVVVTDNSFDAGDFRLEYPLSWSVVKASPATEGQMRLVFVAPDGGEVWLSQVDSIGAAAEGHLVLANGVILMLSITAAEAPSASFDSQARQLISSIRS